MSGNWITVDGNEAVASVAHRTNEVIALYPITPSSSMGELCDAWSAAGRSNVWGHVPAIVEMQSEGGVAGAVHGALQGGALTTTFTASQGLLLMIPNLYKISGELTSFAMHVAARTVATHALSIFGDHSDVMACRQTGVAMLASASVQEAQDFALLAQAATLASRIPILHFFDGFRTSHEIAKIERLSDDDLLALIPAERIAEHRKRALTPDAPVIRGTAQNPDVFFQARESCNSYYDACPALVRDAMDALAERVGRRYNLFDYHGHPAADRVVAILGSAGETVRATVDRLNAEGERVGVVQVRLYRPFDMQAFAASLPSTVETLAVLDRTKEPGALGEPLYLDVVAALEQARDSGVLPGSFRPRVLGGRYGLASKEFTPAMARAVYSEAAQAEPKRRFSVGIVDDVTGLSLSVDESFDLDRDVADTVRAVFFGLGSDGTVGANKNSVKIIGEETELFAQGYFVYDSKKSGAVTVSHLRFGPRPIHAPYRIRRASFVACHRFEFLDRFDVLEVAEPGAVFLLNTAFAPEAIWDRLSAGVQRQILDKKLDFRVIDASKVARESGVGSRINTVMQTCFFAISGVLPQDEAIAKIKSSIESTYGTRGEPTVQANFAAVDRALASMGRVSVPERVSATRIRPPVVAADAPEFVQRVTATMLAGLGDRLPVSAFPVDGSWPVGTARWEKRNIAAEIPVWDEALCIQCNKCAMVCPHAAIRAKVYDEEQLDGRPESFKFADYRGREFPGAKYTIQVAPEDCTGCTLCAVVCPAKDKSNPRHRALDMHRQPPLREAERENFSFFLDLPEANREEIRLDVKGAQFLQPLFEFSGACAGCGETPYIRLLTQLFGDRAVVANATGCSSIYGGNLPTTPYATNADGRGPVWSNSLFEDNAEFGLGIRMALDQHRIQARRLLQMLADRRELDGEFVAGLLDARASTEREIAAQRERVLELKQRLRGAAGRDAAQLEKLADHLVEKSVWIVGGDGWAYDIGFGGLDHVIALGQDVNILVLDTEVYSNTGGQQSKATPRAAAAKFAAAGKSTAKKDLGQMAMAYGNAYVARVAFGAKDAQTVKAFVEAESFPGPSLILAYSPCIAHGYDLAGGLAQQGLAVDSGHWPLYRFDPRRTAEGLSPLQLDSGPPKVALSKYMQNESRFRMVERAYPERFRTLLEQAQADVHAARSRDEAQARQDQE